MGKKEKKNYMHLRLNLLFFAVFIAFSTLIFRLGFLQIIKGESYKQEVARVENVTTNVSVPRGKIYDRYHRVIVENKPLRTISYTRSKSSKKEDRLEVARNLAKLIEMPIDKVTERDKKDFWIELNPKQAEKKITKEDLQLLKDKKISDKDLYKRQLERITEEELAKFTPEDIEVLAIKRQMEGGHVLTPQTIKNQGVTDQEYAIVSERLAELPGVDITSDWDRSYPYENMFRTVLGSVTNSNEGLPKERLDYYLARGYNRTDRVGKSYIEQVHEDVLQGKKSQVKNVTDENGAIMETIYLSKGERGKDLSLTIDMELQKQVEKIIEEELQVAKRNGERLIDRAFVVMMNPKNGEILSMAGKQFVENEEQIQDFALGTMTSSYPMGSVVKGATVFTGYQEGVIQPGTSLLDEEILIYKTPVKKSYKVFGNITDLQALQVSSNAYMFKTAMKIAGTDYKANMKLNVKEEAFRKMRSSFGKFGLGVPTGIDLPNEASGLKGLADKPGFLLDLAIGQYDTYTPLQLAQYVSTIANGGYRLKPQYVKEIRKPTTKEGEIGAVVQSNEPVVLNSIDMKDSSYLKQIQKGFRMVVEAPPGTGYSNFGQDNPYMPAAKTGTAEIYYDGPDKELRKSGSDGKSPKCYNLTFVGYAPYDNPEIAFSVVVPWVVNDTENPVNKKIGKRILEAYFESQKVKK